MNISGGVDVCFLCGSSSDEVQSIYIVSVLTDKLHKLPTFRKWY